MFELGTVIYVLGELRSLAQTWPGVVILLIIVMGLVISLWGDSTPMLQRVKALIFGKRRCPNNPSHIMDPNWAVCRYCEDERRAKEESEKRGGSIPPKPGRDKTRIGTNPSGGDQRGKDDISGGDTRRIVGIMITYTWRPEGQLFPIYEGKNFIGRAEISDEAPPRDCDIQIPQDLKMSAEHALILCRPAHPPDTQGSYEIIDQETTNGTLVDRILLTSNLPVKLPNYATIRTGATEWTFITIEESVKKVTTTGTGDENDTKRRRKDEPVQ